MESSPPVLARVLRGGKTESVHRGDVAVVDGEGGLVASVGDPGRAIYLRSAAKPFQVMPLLETGGEREFRLGSDEIALMCASHGGEPRHVRVARRILRRGRFGVEDLACGAHAPMHEPSARRLIARGERPTALHNNCSGKHGGMLLACRPAGLDPSGYWRRSHPLQETILERVREYCGVPDGEITVGMDGCSLPVSYLPLSALALGYARLVARGGGRDGGPSPRSVRERVCRAFWESPGMIAGLGRFTTDFLRAAPGRWIGKEGAEGVYAIGIRRRNAPALGIAFKMEDGSSRARDAIALEILSGLRELTGPAARYLDPYRRPRVLSVRGEEVGEIVPGIRWNGQ